MKKATNLQRDEIKMHISRMEKRKMSIKTQILTLHALGAKVSQMEDFYPLDSVWKIVDDLFKETVYKKVYNAKCSRLILTYLNTTPIVQMKIRLPRAA